MSKCISGFSKLTKEEKLEWLLDVFFDNQKGAEEDLKKFWNQDVDFQKVFDGFSENTVSNYYMPYGVAPNFLINGKEYCVPMVIEESSVVAAAAAAAKFWQTRGGFHAKVLNVRKIGQVHFYWSGKPAQLEALMPQLQAELLAGVQDLTSNMRKRGGGVADIQLRDMTIWEPGYFQLFVEFETCDSMGANFINSVLEEFARILQDFIGSHTEFEGDEKDVDVLMSILSNYTPDCVVRCEVQCPVEDLGSFQGGMDAATFASRFEKAVRAAVVDPFRATTHNKGIFNGVDAVVLATGNDFRAVEACGHAYASRSGQYSSLSNCKIKKGIFKFWIDLPLAVGTVGGLTKLHPLAKRSLEMLGNPDATSLMEIIAATGLAQNFAAVRSLITTGIQHGHMKMHLLNILNHLAATELEVDAAKVHFRNSVVTFKAVREFLFALRGQQSKLSPNQLA